LVVSSYLQALMRHLIILSIGLLLTSCYVSKEHRLWDKRIDKNLPDNYFYQVLKDTTKKSDTKLKFNYPYVCIGDSGYFHAYSFDKDQKVYSNAWVAGPPELGKILSAQFEIGYYKVYQDTLIIEQVGSWTLFNIPWKFIHTKKVGLIIGDTIKLGTGQIDINERSRALLPFDIYTPFDTKASR
jgi:hypothetical protein